MHAEDVSGVAPQEPIAIGPYVQNVGKDSATICWATLAGELTYAPATQDRRTSSRAYNYHKLTLRYLQPGTIHHYDVLGDGSDVGKGSFVTFPEGEQPFSFVILADCHNQWGAPIVRLAMADEPDLVFVPGDLVCDGLQMFHWEDFFRANRELMRRVPYYPALGNHELDSPFYFDFFSLPGNQRYYSFDRGVVHFVVLDSFGPRLRDVYWEMGEWATNQPVTSHQLEVFEQQKEQYWRDQLAWLKDDLAACREAKYVFVFVHDPPYTSWSRTQEAAARLRARFGTIFHDCGVSAVFSGHDHHYHRALVGGVQFVMTAAGGELLGTDAPQPETAKCWKLHNYARVQVGLDRAHLRATDVDGKVIEELDIIPRPAAPSETGQRG